MAPKKTKIYVQLQIGPKIYLLQQAIPIPRARLNYQKCAVKAIYHRSQGITPLWQPVIADRLDYEEIDIQKQRIWTEE